MSDSLSETVDEVLSAGFLYSVVKCSSSDTLMGWQLLRVISIYITIVGIWKSTVISLLSKYHWKLIRLARDVLTDLLPVRTHDFQRIALDVYRNILYCIQ